MIRALSQETAVDLFAPHPTKQSLKAAGVASSVKGTASRIQPSNYHFQVALERETIQEASQKAISHQPGNARSQTNSKLKLGLSSSDANSRTEPSDHRDRNQRDEPDQSKVKSTGTHDRTTRPHGKEKEADSTKSELEQVAASTEPPQTPLGPTIAPMEVHLNIAVGFSLDAEDKSKLQTFTQDPVSSESAAARIPTTAPLKNGQALTDGTNLQPKKSSDAELLVPKTTEASLLIEKQIPVAKTEVSGDKLGLAFKLQIEQSDSAPSLNDLLHLRSYLAQGKERISETSTLQGNEAHGRNELETSTSDPHGIDQPRDTSKEERQIELEELPEGGNKKENHGGSEIFSNGGSFHKSTSNTSTNHLGKTLREQPIESIAEVTPIKRSVSQLVLRVGEDRHSQVAVRLHFHGSGLRMDVLGSDSSLRESLRVSLPQLEKSMERQATEGGWRVSTATPIDGPLPLAILHEPGSNANANDSKKNDSSRRGRQNQPQNQHRKPTTEQFTLVGERSAI